MKIYALAVLLVVCLVQNASADWRNDVKSNHWQQINSIINSSLNRIRNNANAKGTPKAQQCAEEARVKLRDVTQYGYNAVSNCVYSASTAGIANVCSQKVDSEVFDRSLQVSREANDCLNNA